MFNINCNRYVPMTLRHRQQAILVCKLLSNEVIVRLLYHIELSMLLKVK